MLGVSNTTRRVWALCRFWAAAVACVALCLLLAVAAMAGQGGEKAPVYPVEVVYCLPHDESAFTQGLFFHEGRLYETTGLRGRSRLMELAPATGEVLRMLPLEPHLFGEGAVGVGRRIIWLTWTSGRAKVLALDDFSLQEELRYAGEGWGLTHDGERLLMSDGSDTVAVRDPVSFGRTREIAVRDGGAPVALLNELEFAHGLLYANIWQSPHVAVIDPESGRVLRRLDLSALFPPDASPRAVANGLAWDDSNSCMLVTGKLWPEIYCIRRAGFPGMP